MSAGDGQHEVPPDGGARRSRARWRELAVVAVILAIYAASFARTASYGFVWDDVPEIEHSTSFDRPLGDGLALTQTQRAAGDLAGRVNVPAFFGFDSYRPLLFATYWIDIRWWGRDAGALHRTNVVLGGLAILLAYLLARRLLGSPYALIPTAVFALHPLQIETVAYISGRGDLLAGLLALATAYACVRAIDTPRRARAIAWTAAAAIAFAASLLAKESGVALPLAIAAIVAARTPGSPRRRWWIAAALLVVAVAYFPARGAIVTTKTAGPPADTLLGVPGGLLEYARIFVVPFDLSIERLPHASYVAAGWVVAIAAIALVAWLWWRGRRRRVEIDLTAAGLAWAIAMLAPSMVALRARNIVADRYAYVAIFGLAVALAAGLAQLARTRPGAGKLAAGIGALWAAALLVVGWRQVPAWQDMDALYTNAVEMAPDSSSAHYRIAVLDTNAGRWDLAVPELERAIELDPNNVEALNNLGVYQLSTDAAAAEATLQRAVVASPEHFRAWLNLGLAQLALGHRDTGCASISHALAIDPAYAAALAAQRRSCTP